MWIKTVKTELKQGSDPKLVLKNEENLNLKRLKVIGCWEDEIYIIYNFMSGRTTNCNFNAIKFEKNDKKLKIKK